MMMWVFACLIVLVMGVIAMLAAGRGEPMSPATSDRPRSGDVPSDRPLVPSDLRRVRFSLAVRGYRMSEVDALLDRISTEWEDRAPAPEPPSRAEQGTESAGDCAVEDR